MKIYLEMESNNSLQSEPHRNFIECSSNIVSEDIVKLIILAVVNNM
jgi:hypothetical protein